MEIPMLARTHGQPATPTRVLKSFLFSLSLRKLKKKNRLEKK